ncbi:MAG: multidrug effflux MFS transporter [Alphaproteobacteria bacterium]|nr:multidrug effflux MFS transporter [Alphaproteobacteria bacterium]
MPPALFIATRPGSVALLTFMVALGQMSMGLYTPSMPSMAAALDTSISQVQLTLTVFLAGFAVSQLVWGPVSDRFGRRATLFVGLACFTAAGAACALAETIEQLIVFRFFQALGACSGQVVARAIVRDSAEGAVAAKVMSYIALSMSLSPAITPSIGGLMQEWFGWRSNFVLLALVGLTLATLVLARLPETLRVPVPDALWPGPMRRNYASLLGDRAYLGHVLMVGGMFGGLMSYQTGSPFVLMDQLGWSPRAYGLLILFNVFGFLAGSLLATRYSEAVGSRRMVRFGAVAVLISGLLMLAFPLAGHLSTASLLGPMMLLLFGMGIGLPNAFSGALQGFPRIAGSASALMGFTQMGCGMLASFAVTRMTGDVYLAVGVVCAVSGVGCFLAQALIIPAEVPTATD